MMSAFGMFNALVRSYSRLPLGNGKGRLSDKFWHK